MSNPTTPFGWQMPTATDLVTDLPADFEVFGQAVATSMSDLLGGTTGQILAKASATNMDFTWITNDIGDITEVTATTPLTGGGTSGAITIGIQDASTTQKGSVQLSDSTSTTSSTVAATATAVKAAYDKASTAATTSVAGIVQLSDSTSTTSSVLASTPTAVKSAYDLANGAIAKTTVTTAGDIIYRNATIPTRLGIGTAGQVLTVNAGATAPEWAAVAASGGMTLISTTALSSTATTISSIPQTYKGLIFFIDKVVFSANAELTVALTSATNIYNTLITNATMSGSNAQAKVRSGTSGLWPTGVVFQLMNYTSTGGAQTGQFYYGDSYGGSVNTTFFSSFSSTAVSSLVIGSQAGTSTFTSGTVKLYGVN
jgi:hypothetical protein